MKYDLSDRWFQDLGDEGHRVCIGDIADELQKLARSGVFPEHTANSCLRGAWLLRALRLVIFKSGGVPSQDDALDAFDTLRDILLKNE